MKNDNFSSREKKIRGGWLALHIMELIFLFVPFIATTIYFTSHSEPSSIKALLIGISAFMPTFSTLLFGFLYYCAYKKPGTLLVTLSAFWFGGKIVWTLLFGTAWHIFGHASSWVIVAQVFFIAFFTIHVGFAFAMRKRNQKIFQHQMQSNPVYLGALDFLHTALNLSDLNSKVGELLRKGENSSSERVAAIYSAYEACKSRLA